MRDFGSVADMLVRLTALRDYDPDFARWLQPDPVAVGPEAMYGVLNPWAYCANDPVNASDPTGENQLLLGVFAFGLGFVFGYSLTANGYVPQFSNSAALAVFLSSLITSLISLSTTAMCAGRIPQTLQGLLAGIEKSLLLPLLTLLAAGAKRYMLIPMLASLAGLMVAAFTLGFMIGNQMAAVTSPRERTRRHGGDIMPQNGGDAYGFA